jgi:photosystem II stability/assembly factor-like uncharacterized protein
MLQMPRFRRVAAAFLSLAAVSGAGYAGPTAPAAFPVHVASATHASPAVGHVGATFAHAAFPSAQSEQELTQDLVWRNIGPANPGGRIVDIEAVEGDFKRVLVATASGGIWKSVNGGNSWEPIFDDYPVSSIGDIAIFQGDPEIIWVGTGEANNRNSVSWGNGVYRSTDGGASFEHLGLDDTHQIARVVTHPSDPDIAYVAAIGHLWGHTGDRGLFKTTDGGRTWTKLGTDAPNAPAAAGGAGGQAGGLPSDGRTGAIDLVMDPRDPDVLYVAFYERLRRPWIFESGGPGGGIFKSTDGGVSWTKLTAGLPPGPTGRIGLAIYRSDPDVVMAFIETERPAGQANDSSDPEDLATLGPGIYRSVDAGASWTYVNTYNNRPFYYSQIRINPLDDRRVYLLTTRFMVSDDGGATLRNGAEDEEIHGDFHAMWIDPTDADRYYIGQDKGAFLTQDHGERFVMFDNLPIAQYYRIGVDMRDPYYVYGGLQDNGSWAGPSFSRDVRGILNDSNWKMHWGDGMFVQIDPTDWRKVYTEAEGGSFRRYDPVTHETGGDEPGPDNVSNFVAVARAAAAERGLEIPERDRLADAFPRQDPLFRFNWTAPLVMSHHDTRTLYLAGNHVFRTTDAGDTWTVISPDLSTNDPVKRLQGVSGGLTPDNSGAEQHCTITTLSESPITRRVIWAGTDDGNVQVTRDGGVTWTNVRANVPGVPEGIWVSRLEASHFAAGEAYLSFDGHRSDTFTPWVFKTTDYGESWVNITSNLPDGHVVRVVREDLRNPDLLFAGTEFGLFVSIDDGESWSRFMNGLPTVSIYDLVIHPRDNDLIAGTHGRSIWILDDISPLQQLTAEVRARDGWLFEQRAATLWENVSRGGQRGHFWWAGGNPATIEPTSSLARARFRNNATISLWVRSADVGSPVLTITDGEGNAREVHLDPVAGVRRWMWDLRFGPRQPLSDAQLALIDERFQQRLAAAGEDAQEIAAAYDAFQAAPTDYERVRAVQETGILGGFGGRGGRGGGGGRGAASALDDLRAAMDLPEAGAGTYFLELTVGSETHTGTLTVRPDPILHER